MSGGNDRWTSASWAFNARVTVALFSPISMNPSPISSTMGRAMVFQSKARLVGVGGY